MFFDLDFLNLELKAAADGIVPPELTSSPVFRAIAFHEQELNRPALSECRFREYLDAAANGDEQSWGLSTLFRRRTRLLNAMAWLDAERDAITEVIFRWLRFFTSAPMIPDLRCVLYVGTYDGGFKLGETIYLNLPAISCREAFFETLAHESFHARRRTPMAEERIRMIEETNDYLGGVLYFTFEEGIAEFIGYNGFTATRYPILHLRSPEQGAQELRELLWRYHRREMTGEELYQTFRATDCCYTAGVTIASAVWASQGKEGLDLWSLRCDRRAFYEAFRATPQGALWPELEL